MATQLTEQEIWNLIGYIKISPYRLQTFMALKNNFLMPTEIARLTGMKPSQASSALKDLKNKNLVVCMNDDARKGRIYQITETGMQIIIWLENRKN